MGRIIITGGTGLIGNALLERLTADGHEVLILSRNPAKARRLPQGARAMAWDGRTANGWGALADGAQAIINLAGATLARPPWTTDYKRTIRESRINAGRAVTEAVRLAQQKPQVVIQSSGVNYYGLHGDQVVTEETPAGDDFLAEVCKAWEASTAEVEAMGVRHVIMRTAPVLSDKGGILPLIALPFRLFVGGPLGGGQQYWTWIHLADAIGALCFLLANDAAGGPFNLSAPNPVRQAEFSRALARALHRPAWFPTPGFAMKLTLGEMAELLILGSQRVVPQRLQQMGYPFRFTNIATALNDLYG